jgi:hypothetical protein
MISIFFAHKFPARIKPFNLNCQFVKTVNQEINKIFILHKKGKPPVKVAWVRDSRFNYLMSFLIFCCDGEINCKK